MMRPSRTTVLLGLLLLAQTGYLIGRRDKPPSPPALLNTERQLGKIEPVTALNNGRWIRSFRTTDGTLYLKGGLLSRDGGQTVQSAEIPSILEEINASPERAAIVLPGLFYAIKGKAELERTGIYRVQGWRSTDDLKTLTPEVVRIEVPEGPQGNGKQDEWYGLYVYRTILEMPDGSWLLTMYGNFDSDTLHPNDRSSQHEVKCMMRTIVLTSHDRGQSWKYLATVAAPRAGDPIGEGFVEPAITRLQDGRLLCIMRTGHYFPLYASWSSDSGKSWSAPVYTGLDRGCDPCLITLSDGRAALSWGKRFPEGYSRLDSVDDATRFAYPGEGLVNLAISENNGKSWINHPVATGMGSCYSTIFEVEPGILFFQADQWIWRVKLLQPTEESPHERSAHQ
jgi:hypothetical protein